MHSLRACLFKYITVSVFRIYDALEGFFSGYRAIGQTLKGIWDTFVKIQSILEIW